MKKKVCIKKNMPFTMINESFECENCSQKVSKHPEGSARNHCPECLYSKHLDEGFPGDRLSKCLGKMQPVGTSWKKNKGNMIHHQCEKCGKKSVNKTAPDDKFLELYKKINDGFLESKMYNARKS